MNTKRNNFKIGGWLYFSGSSVSERWWEISEITQRHFSGDIENNIPAGDYYNLGLEHDGHIFWYPEYNIQPFSNNGIKYVDTPEEKLFVQLSEKNL